MIVEQIKYSQYVKKRASIGSSEKTGKLTIIITEKAILTIEQEAQLIKFLETL